MLEVRTATYGPGIDQSQHAKSVSHIINLIIYTQIHTERQKSIPVSSLQTKLISDQSNVYSIKFRPDWPEYIGVLI